VRISARVKFARPKARWHRVRDLEALVRKNTMAVVYIDKIRIEDD